MKAKYAGQPYDDRTYEASLRQSVATVVREQVQCGIEIVGDGEYSKPDFSLTSASGSTASNRGQVLKLIFSRKRSPHSPILRAVFQAGDDGGAIVSLAPVVWRGAGQISWAQNTSVLIIENVKAARRSGRRQ